MGGIGYGFGSPFGSPFGYSPFGRPGISFYGGGFGVNPVDLLVLGGVAYGVSQLVKVGVGWSVVGGISVDDLAGLAGLSRLLLLCFG